MTEETIFAAALEKADPAERAAVLAGACGNDVEFRRRIEALLAAHDNAGRFLDHPAVAAPETAYSTTRAFVPTPDPDAESTHTGGGSPGPAFDESLGFLKPATRPGSLGRIGHYEVLEVLGHGGFGIVFRAFDDVLQRVVAVKVLAPQLAATSPARKRFIREAQSSAKIRHENVVQVHGVEEQPLPYLVMEFIPGETLQQRLDRVGPLEVPEVLRIGRQIAEGLAAAHATDLIHRDVKPGNVMIESGPHPKVKLTDFGLARAADDASISQSGVVAGTPMYMAPEQAKGDALDHRADLFSLGSVLYVMCTGRPPFRANSTLAVLKRVAEDEPRPIREIIPEVPVWLCRIVEKLHAKEPADRLQSAREVADLLADCESQIKTYGALRDFSRIPGGQSLRPRRRRLAVIAGSLALLLLVCGAVWAGPYALRYIGNRGDVEITPEAGWVSVIVHKGDDAVTDWFGVNKRPTIKLPPGRYKLEPGFAPGRLLVHWEITTHGLFASHTLLQFKRAPEIEVARGERVTVRAVMRDEPPPPPPQPPPPELPKPEEGFVPLFNGEDLSGWRPGPQQAGNWRVEKGILIGSGPAKASHLFTERGDFQDFHLRAEAKINLAGNSGIYFRAPFALGGGYYPKAYEAQIFAGEAATFKEEFKTGSLYGLNRGKGSPPPGDSWFTLEVVARGNRITIKVNGATTVDEFKDDQYQRGHFALQQLGPETVAQFRKIEIKELPPGKTDAPPPAVAPFDAAKAKELQEAWAKHLGVAPEITNSLGMKLRVIPPGKFPMRPNRQVTLTKPFRMAAHEVTVAQFRAFVKDTKHRTTAEVVGAGVVQHTDETIEAGPKFTWQHKGVAGGDDYPVGQLSWDDAVAFCQWLSRKEGKTYRLPTEAEWDWACRAGSVTEYHFGDDEALLGEYAWFAQNSDDHSHPVGQKKPNPWGLYDMHGNIAEFCQDWWGPLAAGDVVDPTGPADGKFRVVRSYCFFNPGAALTMTNSRGALSPWSSMNQLGFRVVLEDDRKAKPPAGGADPKPANPDPVQALRDVVAAKERSRDAAKAGAAVGTVSFTDLLQAEIEYADARIQLAEAEQNKGLAAALLQVLVALWEAKRALAAMQVEKGLERREFLNQIEARLADAKERLAKARAELPPPEVAPPPRPKP